jgi:hypothetical protein
VSDAGARGPYDNNLLMREFAVAAIASGLVTRAIAKAGVERVVAPGGDGRTFVIRLVIHISYMQSIIWKCV